MAESWYAATGISYGPEDGKVVKLAYGDAVSLDKTFPKELLQSWAENGTIVNFDIKEADKFRAAQRKAQQTGQRPSAPKVVESEELEANEGAGGSASDAPQGQAEEIS